MSIPPSHMVISGHFVGKLTHRHMTSPDPNTPREYAGLGKCPSDCSEKKPHHPSSLQQIDFLAHAQQKNLGTFSGIYKVFSPWKVCDQLR